MTRASESNRRHADGSMRIEAAVDKTRLEFAFDAQTSGGLLISLPPDKVDALMRQLEEHGVSGAVVVGEVSDGVPGSIRVLP